LGIFLSQYVNAQPFELAKIEKRELGLVSSACWTFLNWKLLSPVMNNPGDSVWEDADSARNASVLVGNSGYILVCDMIS
jgi:hypothetical protein